MTNNIHIGCRICMKERIIHDYLLEFGFIADVCFQSHG